MSVKGISVFVIIEAFVLVSFCNICPTAAASIGGLGILAGHSTNHDRMATTDILPSVDMLLDSNATNSTGQGAEDYDNWSRVPRWTLWCVGCGGFVGGVGASLAYFGLRHRWRKMRSCRGDLNGCVVMPNLRMTGKIQHKLQKNLKHAIHRIPDIFSTENTKTGYSDESDSCCTGGKRAKAEKPVVSSNNHLQRLLSTQSTFRGENLPFITQFSDIVTSDGGEILSPDSDVSVVVPPGAVPEGRMQLIYVNVALSLEEFGVGTGPTEYQLTPVVECLAPGLDRFRVPVTVKIPHRADITVAAKPWQFNVIYSQSPAGKEMNWYRVPPSSTRASCPSANQNQASDVTFNYDANFVYIRTNHFTLFTCTGCGKRARPPLKLSAVIYGNEKTLEGRQQVNLRVYICDASTDVQRRITNMESSYNGSQLSQFKPLSVQNSKDWQIELTSVRDGSWPWKLLTNDDAIKSIPMDVCYHCCSAPPSVDFRVVPQDDTRRLGGMESTFCVSQLRRRPEEMVRTQLVTHDFRFQSNLSASSTLHLEDQVSDMEANHVIFIQRHLLPRDMPRVGRRLGLSDVDIASIQRDYQNNYAEQVHQMISLWMTRRGRHATLRAFCDALEEEEIREIADGLRSLNLSYDA